MEQRDTDPRPDLFCSVPSLTHIAPYLIPPVAEDQSVDDGSHCNVESRRNVVLGLTRVDVAVDPRHYGCHFVQNLSQAVAELLVLSSIPALA